MKIESKKENASHKFLLTKRVNETIRWLFFVGIIRKKGEKNEHT